MLIDASLPPAGCMVILVICHFVLFIKQLNCVYELKNKSLDFQNKHNYFISYLEK